MNFLRCAVFLSLVGVLSACHTLKRPSETNVNQSQHQLTLEKLDHWQIDGRLGFKNSKESVSASLRWKQNQQDYDIRLSKLGITQLRMIRKDENVTLSANNHTYQDTNADRLIRRITGWNLPVSQLPQWIKGRVDNLPSALFNDNGLLSDITSGCIDCEQWHIHYSNYKEVNQVPLPHYIELTQSGTNGSLIKIKINKWSIK